MNPYRLSRNVVPSRYDLKLEPDLLAANFHGEVRITAQVEQETSEIVLNALELEVVSAQVERGSEVVEASITLDEKTERCHLHFSRAIPSGPIKLRLKFRGTLNDKLRGFYRSQYKTASGDTRYVGVTQFEATSARRAFPCWDEPSFKAVFQCQLVVDKDLVAISNTSILSEQVEGKKRWVSFKETIPMSTYLVAFIVGDFEASEPAFVGKTPLRVWCVSGKKALTKTAQQIGTFTLDWYEKYYGYPYPGSKLDLIAIPDFAAGAMENLGAITFRETALLVDPAQTTHNELERIADVIAHENSHMWFGDLVTMSWWNGLWLNEAFATFMETLAVDAWKPEWSRWTTFGASRSEAFVVDGLHSTRPIEYPVEAPEDAEAMFDVLTYEKGASVLRMLEQFIGGEVFQKGVRTYLKRHALNNTETEDLWVALGEASAQPIPKVMNGWIFQPGYPIVNAKIEGSDTLVLNQQRFTYLSAEEATGKSNLQSHFLWQIPIQFKVLSPDGEKVERTLLSEAQTKVSLTPGWEAVLLNEGGHGYYRARYSPELMEKMVGGGKTKREAKLDRLAPIERMNLVSDAWAAVLAGLMPLTEYLSLVATFKKERDKNVWTTLIGSLHTLHRMVEKPERPSFEAWVRELLHPAFDLLGWETGGNDSELDRQLRGDLIRALGTLGNDPAVQKKAIECYEKEQKEVDGNVMAAAIAVVASSGNASRYEEFLQRFQTAKTPQLEQRFLFSLAAFRDPALVQQTLGRTINGEMRSQDAPFVLRALLMSTHGRELTWQFMQAQWEKMNEIFPPVGVRRMCEGVVGLNKPEWERQVRDFFGQKNVQWGGKTLPQYLERLRIAVRLREREGQAFHQFLSSSSKPGSKRI